ncbi:hypothetical protein ElyMa_000008600 [Elysia marginata]|uniref:SH3 domain-containing protein n=1 Tax=Elysia marginata TaxID=1093978 RepID=A0AAV4EAS8_9GAST|nr:hypothetical protein ElyMa_000008600 [Elysia marginata]
MTLKSKIGPRVIKRRKAKEFAETSARETDSHDQARCGPSNSAAYVQYQESVVEITKKDQRIKVRDVSEIQGHWLT